MDISKEFKKWYRTEGIRTPCPTGEHFHEFFQSIAFEAGANWMAKELLPRYEKELKRQEKDIAFLKKAVRKIANQ